MTVERWSEAAGSVLGVQRANLNDLKDLNFLDPIWSTPSQTARILDPPRRMERAQGQRPMRRRGAIERDWAGGGYFSVSGDSCRWGARPPSASNGDKARVLPIGPRPRRLVPSETTGTGSG